MKYLELKVNLPKEVSEEFTAFLDSLSVEGYYEILFDSTLPRPASGEILRDDTNIHVYLGETDLEKEMKIYIYLKAVAGDKSFVESRIVETKEFEEAYKEFYKPFQVGENFWIVPTWEKETEFTKNLVQRQNNIILFMNPGLAFGTGHHETTKLMIARIDKIVQEGMSVLDLGTGSGILSIAAAYKKAKEILAIDIDPNAVRATEFNWKENSFPDPVQFTVQEGGFDHPSIGNKHFDLLLGNITYAVISQNIEWIQKMNIKHFLFSGLIIERREDSIRLFQEKLGGRLVYEEQLNDWIILEWER
ncbi:MAG TPA: 50S ribosomal protein L11 methyltransferase [Leptospiraceae bacterium]|nr:50S ribosomal protein L11 methyltransferase [Leptospiraceae bacterium]HMW05466.1 50S ribosomal protein L11 methyltransferase [Leptospiraceae bacterium]HMX33227.1 50S ribosomal protein L11 methyltransferase [Leptospiraceae bacterium]HMY30976.1 50S ribosomal protein L11 methyltransferase [Leptospiraceae bacterium]HMZ64410.1 50S ribosomal protein L11 methyltransferase [Leptospiraceae bacterium]